MANGTVRIEGLDEVIDMFRRSDEAVKGAGRAWLRDMGIEGVNITQRHILNVGAVDTNELIQGMHYDLDTNIRGMQVTIRPSDKADDYAIYMEEGTKPHKAPISALQGWADRHGIPVGAVWHKIATEGTDPRWMFRDSFNELDKQTDRQLPRFIDDVLRRMA